MSGKVKVLLFGAGGQLGSELLAAIPSCVECIAFDAIRGDVSDASRVEDILRSSMPAVVINAAAFTSVDGAESARERAFEVNRDGPENLAASCARIGARLLHVSTDFVFGGNARSPYEVDALPNPINVYGQSKLAGERAVLDNSLCSAIVLRTAWLYGKHGSNFVSSIMRRLLLGEPLQVVCDQFGSPTWTRSVAGVLWRLCDVVVPNGIYHWTDGGCASRFEFACAVRDIAFAKGILGQRPEIIPIKAKSLALPAVRPNYSALDSQRTARLLGITQRSWRSALEEYLTAVSFDA